MVVNYQLLDFNISEFAGWKGEHFQWLNMFSYSIRRFNCVVSHICPIKKVAATYFTQWFGLAFGPTLILFNGYRLPLSPGVKGDPGSLKICTFITTTSVHLSDEWHGSYQSLID
jgi:hypothetical protein